MELLFVNIMLYIVLFFCVFKKEQWRVNDIVIIPMIWLICSLFSLLSYISPLCYNGYARELTIIPFLWLFLIFNIFYSYLWKYNSSQVKDKLNVTSLVKVLASIFALSALIPFIENVFVIIFRGVDWSFVLTAKDLGIEISATSHMSSVAAQLMTINYYGFFLLPYFFFLLIRSKRHNFLILCGLGMAMLNILMVNMLNGSRNIIIQYILYILYNYLFHKNSLSGSIKKTIKIIAIISGSLILIYILFITLNRFSDVDRSAMGSPADWLFLYIGEEFQNFNCDGWWIGFKAKGIVSFDSLCNVLGIHTQKISLPYREYMFYTAFNDLYIDFGPYVSVVIALAFTCIIWCYSSYLLKSNDYHSYSLVNNLFAFYLLCGMWYNPYVNLWYQFFGAIAILVIFRFASLQHKLHR